MNRYYKAKDVEIALIFSGLCDGKTCAEVKEVLNSIPTIDRPQGGWIEDPINKNNMYCSNCKVSYTKDFLRGMSLYHEPKDTPSYCPNCGVHMKGADDE